MSRRSTATDVMRSCTGCQAPRRSLCTWKLVGTLRVHEESDDQTGRWDQHC